MGELPDWIGSSRVLWPFPHWDTNVAAILLYLQNRTIHQSQVHWINIRNHWLWGKCGRRRLWILLSTDDGKSRLHGNGVYHSLLLFAKCFCLYPRPARPRLENDCSERAYQGMGKHGRRRGDQPAENCLKLSRLERKRY